jgi:serine/threonine protein kinase
LPKLNASAWPLPTTQTQVVNFIGACHRAPARCLVTEYCARGSLDKLLHGPTGAGLSLTKRVEFALDVARGMAALHSQRPPIIHRDLKTANLLVTSRMEVKVADFGLSRIKDATHVRACAWLFAGVWGVEMGDAACLARAASQTACRPGSRTPSRPAA